MHRRLHQQLLCILSRWLTFTVSAAHFEQSFTFAFREPDRRSQVIGLAAMATVSVPAVVPAADMPTEPNSTTTSYPSLLQFQPFSSAVDVSFWTELARLKLDILQLSSAPLPILATYTTATHARQPSQLLLGSYSFARVNGAETPLQSDQCVYDGRLCNANTIDEFRRLDTNGLLDALRDEVWSEISRARQGGAAEPQLNRFLLLTYADLKAHKYYYWFAFPALLHPSLAIHITAPPQPIDTALSAEQCSLIVAAVKQLVVPHVFQPPTAGEMDTAASAVSSPFFVVHLSNAVSTVHRLSQLPSLLATSDPATSSILLGFIDPSSLPSHPGWPLRNLLLYGAVLGMRRARVLCFRDLSTLPGSPLSSLVLDLSLSVSEPAAPLVSIVPRCVGYERNTHNKLAPRLIDLSSLMSPLVLAASSVNLNLRLMRWRALPALNLPLLASTRCLLLGAGTLGCAVARLLLAWGFTRITFVDSGGVSYSNPVRQSLYTWDDSRQGKSKAECAAERLRDVYPGVQSSGVRCVIPMVGHWSEKEDGEMRRGVSVMERLVDEHDVVILLTDSRESRWLPTLLCAGKNKLCMNAALGFDSYLVMRHGDNYYPNEPRPTDASSSSSSTTKLGCYFCGDVVAPTDSSRDRTLDQQCTVTRPGLAYIASAYLVELLVNTLHHTQRQRAPAAPNAHGLACLPHQLRGFLSSFEAVKVEGARFAYCSACSEAVVDGYVKGGVEWVMMAMRGGAEWLEEVSGLSGMKRDLEQRMQQTDWAVDEADEDDELLDDVDDGM